MMLENLIVDHNQLAFIKNRYIMDNVMAAHEIIHYATKYKQKGIVLKVDFEKAYAKVNWSFVQEMLLSRGFGSKLTQWIMSLFKGSNTCINFNGNSSSYFQCKRGLWQGTPYPPSCLI
jgi:NADH dehydrogenase FAD-containing subunit